jgi:formylglycine-generating enzyme required for sulfatase activity
MNRRRYNPRFLLAGILLSVLIFIASLALFPSWGSGISTLVALLALAVTAGFGLLANFRQAVEEPPSAAIATGGGDHVEGDQTNVNMGHVIGSTVVVGTVEKQEIHQQVNTPELMKMNAETGKQNYLTAIMQFCQALNIAPLGKEVNDITLDHIYIDLDTTAFLEDEHKVVPEFSGEKQDKEPLSALAAIERSRLVVLLGAPGAGKSTFAKKICGWLARAHQEGIAPPPGVSRELIPVYLVLRDFGHALRIHDFEKMSPDQQRVVMLQAFKEQLKQELSRLDAVEYLDYLLQVLRKGNCLLVLDGLDEVPYDLRARVRQLVGAIIEAYSPQRMIITCRVRSYSGSVEIPGFVPYTLSPFDEEKITRFAQAWYQAFKQHYSEAQLQERQDDLSRAALSPLLQDLSSNPMLLTVMAIIHQEDVHLPPERVKLYQRAVELLLRRWQKHKTGELAPSDRLEAFLNDSQRIYPAIERLAFEAHRAPRKDQLDAPELLRKDALDLLERNECKCEDQYPLAHEFLDYIDQRSGLLAGKGEAPGVPASYSFPHRTFQEYLAGCYLASQRYLFRALRPLAGEGDTWDLVTKMAFEELFHNRRGVYTLLETSYDLCHDCSEANEADQRLVFWAGQIAELIGKKVYEEDTDKPEQSRHFLDTIGPSLVQVLQGKLLRAERVEVGNILARLGDPRFRPDAWFLPDEPLLGFVEIPAGSFLMGSDPQKDGQAFGDEQPQHTVELPQYWIARYPVTVAQFRAFCEDSGYQKHNQRALGGVDNHPVVWVYFHDALAYCNWLTVKLSEWDGTPAELKQILASGGCVTLPSEAEWEKAARGEDGLIYPWGDVFDSEKANTGEGGVGTTSAVGCFPSGASPYVLQEMSGNVWEWTRSLWVEDYPYDPKDENREDLQAGDKKHRVLRGGSWGSYGRGARCACRFRNFPDLFGYYVGFRVMVRPSSTLNAGTLNL